MEILEPDAVIDSLGLPYLRELSTFGALSDKVIVEILSNGCIKRFEKGEVLSSYGKKVTGFSIVLQGDVAFYMHREEHDVLTRHFRSGEQMCFDLMIGMLMHNGTEVAAEDTLMLHVSSNQFFDLHIDYPNDFGLLMINLSRELSREIAMLEDALGKSTGWNLEL